MSGVNLLPFLILGVGAAWALMMLSMRDRRLTEPSFVGHWERLFALMDEGSNDPFTALQVELLGRSLLRSTARAPKAIRKMGASAEEAARLMRALQPKLPGLAGPSGKLPG